jgi:hypothetical protein
MASQYSSNGGNDVRVTVISPFFAISKANIKKNFRDNSMGQVDAESMDFLFIFVYFL